jgi:hypothetical protein
MYITSSWCRNHDTRWNDWTIIPYLYGDKIDDFNSKIKIATTCCFLLIWRVQTLLLNMFV